MNFVCLCQSSTLIESMAKFSICDLIGARSRECPITGIQFELFVTAYLQLDTHVIRASITCAFMASSALFRTVFKTYEKRHRRFAPKKFSKDIFNSEICYRYD